MDCDIMRLYKEGFSPLMDQFIIKHKQFEDLFTTKEILGWVSNQNSNRRGKDYIDENLGKVKPKDWLEQEVLFKDGKNIPDYREKLESISLKIMLRGFKNAGLNTFDAGSNLAIQFLPFKYQINYNGILLKEKTYSETLDQAEANNLISEMIKKLLEEIKQRMDTK